MKEGFILGAGAQGRVVLDILRLQYPKTEWFFIDENKSYHGKKINGTTIIGDLEFLKNRERPSIHLALGDPRTKQYISKKCRSLGVGFITVIHPSAVVMQSAIIGRGSFIGACAIINTNAQIGDHVIINTQAIIEHDTLIENYVNISPNACIGSRVRIAARTFIGSGANVRARISIGQNSIIGMGSLVTKDLPEKVLAYGFPVKIIKKINNNFDWSKVL